MTTLRQVKVMIGMMMHIQSNLIRDIDMAKMRKNEKSLDNTRLKTLINRHTLVVAEVEVEEIIIEAEVLATKYNLV